MKGFSCSGSIEAFLNEMIGKEGKASQAEGTACAKMQKPRLFKKLRRAQCPVKTNGHRCEVRQERQSQELG